MKVAVIGRGRVGTALAPTIKAAGHEIAFGVRAPDDPRFAGSAVRMLTTSDAVAWADVVIAAINWKDVDGFLADAGDMAGKILVDCINPLDFTGGLRRLIDGNISTASVIQGNTNAIVVKTLNQVGSAVMADPSRFERRPLQFVAADNAIAKERVTRLLDDLGFDVRDAGGLDHAVDLEAMARLWIAQAFTKGMAADTAWLLGDAVHPQLNSEGGRGKD